MDPSKWVNRHNKGRDIKSHSQIGIYADLYWPCYLLLLWGISQQLSQGHLSGQIPPDTCSEGACEGNNRREQVFLQACWSVALHAEGGVSKNVTVTSDRWKATPHDITLQGSLFLRNPTHPQRWQGMPTVMEPCVEEGAFVSIYPHLARDLLSRYPPQSSSSLLCLCQLKPRDILYSLHTLDNGFQILQGGPHVPDPKMESKHKSATPCSYLTLM